MLDLSYLSPPHRIHQPTLLGPPPKYRGLYFPKIMIILFLPFQFVFFFLSSCISKDLQGYAKGSTKSEHSSHVLEFNVNSSNFPLMNIMLCQRFLVGTLFVIRSFLLLSCTANV